MAKDRTRHARIRKPERAGASLYDMVTQDMARALVGFAEGTALALADLADAWRFGFQVWCGRCKCKMPYKWGPWKGYTKAEIEELGREDFHRHAPDSADEPARLAAIDVWNRRANGTD